MLSHEKADSDFVSIVVADNTSIHTQLLADALRNDRGLQVVAAASNSEELLAAVTRVPIDVVVISHNLDDQPGYGVVVLREMRALRPQIKGVILLDSSNPQEVLECFRAGARGIFSKHERIESLGQCIRNVHEGQIWARSVDLDHAFEALANSPLVRATNHKGIELLSSRERQVIQHVAGGMSNREIAKALDLSPHTVKNYLFRIFDKLGVSSRTELLYLTMAHTSAVQPVNHEEPPLAALIAAAEAGDPSAQLRMAEYFSQIKDVQSKTRDVQNKKDVQSKDWAGKADKGIDSGTHQQVADCQSASISAYMWYLLAEKTAPPMLEQIGTGKEAMRQTMSPQQLAEAESRAAAWIRHRREVETSGQRKMHVSAR
jgi:DNA-binding NarL/FixJ family response regulator